MNNNPKIKFHYGVEQRSPEWYKLKVGIFSASENHKLTYVSKITEGALTYIDTKLTEILTGELEDVDSKAMEWGRTYEPIAKIFYSEATGEIIEEVGFVTNSDFKNCGVSPDGVDVEEKKGYEIKCPFTKVNHKKLINCKNAKDLKKVKKEYYWQIIMCLLITDFDSWQFISFNPFFNAVKDLDLRMWTFEIKRKDVEQDIEFLGKRLNEASELLKIKLSELEKYKN